MAKKLDILFSEADSFFADKENFTKFSSCTVEIEIMQKSHVEIPRWNIRQFRVLVSQVLIPWYNMLYKHQLEFDLHVIKTPGYQWRRIWYFQVKSKSNDMKLNAESQILL